MFEITPFVNTMNRTFKDMVGVELSNGAVELPDDSKVLSDITATMGIHGEDKASLVVTVDESASLFLTKVMTGKDVKLEDRIVTDTIGELLNMIVGAAQKESKQKFDFSVPVTFMGKNHEVRAVNRGYFRRVMSHFSEGTVGLYLAKEMDS